MAQSPLQGKGAPASVAGCCFGDGEAAFVGVAVVVVILLLLLWFFLVFLPARALPVLQAAAADGLHRLTGIDSPLLGNVVEGLIRLGLIIGNRGVGKSMLLSMMS